MAASIPEVRSRSQVVRLESCASTNAELLAHAERGAEPWLWIVSKQQTGGRGRAGRSWSAPEGNLSTSLLLRPSCPPMAAAQLALIAGIAAHDAILEAAAGEGDALRTTLRLKWPNDILADGLKLGGILLESLPADASGRLAVVIGIGINVRAHPEELAGAATNLAEIGLATTPENLFDALANAMAHWVDRWSHGAGFAHVRQAWLERATPLGTRVTVQSGKQRLAGSFAGLDEDGALLLRSDEGPGTAPLRITAGDVMLVSQTDPPSKTG